MKAAGDHPTNFCDWCEARLSTGRQTPAGRADAYASARDKIAFYEAALRKVHGAALERRAALAALANENRKLREQIATVRTGDATEIGLGGRKNRDA
jgi:hypothetical protein